MNKELEVLKVMKIIYSFNTGYMRGIWYLII